MSKFLKYLLIIVGMAAVLLIAYSFFDRQFRLSNIKGDWPKASPTQLTDKQHTYLKEIFSQPFHYIDRGKQSFVFVSQDQLYIIKFFDNRCLRSGNLPFIFSIRAGYCSKKLIRLFEGYRIAAAHDMENAGLLFLQLAPDSSYNLWVTVLDRFHIKHVINLAELPFVLQKKAIPLRELITHLLSHGKVDEAKYRFHQIIDMYIDEYRRGILDLDHNFMYNTGFVDDHPLRIDLGRLQLNEKIKDPKEYLQDLEKIVIIRLGSWLDRHFPIYRQEILEDMQRKLDEFSFSSDMGPH